MKMKKILALGMAMTMAMSLSACGGSSSAAESAKDKASSVKDKAESAKDAVGGDDVEAEPDFETPESAEYDDAEDGEAPAEDEAVAQDGEAPIG